MTLQAMTSEAGPEMDRAIAEKVMGWSIYHYDKGGPGDEYWMLLDADMNAVIYSPRLGVLKTEFPTEADAFAWFSPSTNIAQAWEVVEHLHAKGYHIVVINCPGCDAQAGNGWACDLIDEKDEKCAIGIHAETAPLAICLAALMVKRLEGEVGNG